MSPTSTSPRTELLLSTTSTPTASHALSPSPRPLQSVTPLPRRITHEINKGGYLESTTLGIVLLIAAALLLAGWGAAGLRRRAGRPRLLATLPRWSVNLAVGLACFLLVVLGVAVLVNAYVGYVPTLSALVSGPENSSIAGGHRLPPVSNADHSRVVRIDIPGPAQGISSGPAYVYLPAGYDQPANARRRYPVVYLIHGFPGRAEDWFTAGQAKKTMDLLLAHHYLGPMILVSVTGSSGYFNDDECLNSVGRLRVEDYLAFTVPNAIDHTFRTIPKRADRAIGGMSSGGYCALNIGLHHLHRFGLILASEPYGDPGTHAFDRMLNHNLPLLDIDSPSRYLPYWQFPVPVDVFLDSGSRDRYTTNSSYLLARGLADKGQLVAYRAVASVGHNWREARRALPYALIFAWSHFGHLPNGGSDANDRAQLHSLLAFFSALHAAERSHHASSAPTASPTPTASATGMPTPTRTSTPSTSPSHAASPRPSRTPSRHSPTRITGARAMP